MNLNLKNILPAAGLALSALFLLPGCFTGIESTARIKDKSSAGKDAGLTPEQTLLADAVPQPPADWQLGKAFIVTEGRHVLAFSPAADAQRLHPGDTLRLVSILPVARLSGDTVTDISFSSPAGNLTHRIDIRPSQLLAGSSLPIPFTVDADAVGKARQILLGKKVWSRKPDSKGEKYSPVTITAVLPGSPEYPLILVTSSADSVRASTRTFPALFSLSDPRLKYPQISDENWAKISKGQIAIGMTRDECRLALGAPSTVDREAAYNALIERWVYPGGIILHFSDNILTSFRR